MPRLLTLSAAALLGLALPALATPPTTGSYDLRGQDDRGVPTSVRLDVDGQRYVREADTTGRWVSVRTRRVGRRIFVTYADECGSAGMTATFASLTLHTQAESILAVYHFSVDGVQVGERVFRTGLKPGWRSIRTAGSRTDTADSILRSQMAAAGVVAVAKPAREDADLVDLGRDLYFDKVLSGNRNIACATCHHPDAASSDDLPLPIGEGGRGLAMDRLLADGAVIPRNAPDVWNDGLPGVAALMWDSRIGCDPESGELTTPEPALNGPNPARPDLAQVLDHTLAAQAMFPVTSHDEMRGHAGENDLADAANNEAVWDLLMGRLQAIPGYRRQFARAYPEVPSEALNFAHAAKAIAAFEREAFTALDTPLDHYLRGRDAALSAQAKEGAALFFGEARCAECHRGPQLSDGLHHVVAVPQLGPGKAADGDDRGLGLITGDPADDYAFRTPALRNVARTGPYFHDGAVSSLREAVLHHLDPATCNANYDPSQLREDFRPLVDTDAQREAARLAAVAPALKGLRAFSDAEVEALVAFLEAMTDPSAGQVRVPRQVPSGLPVAD